MVGQFTAFNASDLFSSLQDLACARVNFIFPDDGIVLFLTFLAVPVTFVVVNVVIFLLVTSSLFLGRELPHLLVFLIPRLLGVFLFSFALLAFVTGCLRLLLWGETGSNKHRMGYLLKIH